MPETTTEAAGTGDRRTLIGVLSALVLVIATVVGLGATGTVAFGEDKVTGSAAAIFEEIPGPETGPVCPLDKRYVDEQPVGLRPEVLDAFTRLRAAAGEAGVRLCVQDSKRSRGQQEREFAEAVKKFGTPELAGRYVLSPEKSMHVRGIAVDIQPLASAGWVERNGSALGWCRRYENEGWHFEYDPAYSAGCPPMLPSATGS